MSYRTEGRRLNKWTCHLAFRHSASPQGIMACILSRKIRCLEEEVVQSPLLPAPLPENGGRYVRLVSPKVGSPVSGLIYSSAILGINTHYVNGRTSPCLGPGPECIGHREGSPVRWKGFLFGLSDQSHQPCIFEIPADTVRKCLSLRDSAVNLRGALITLSRIGPNANSPVSCSLRTDARPDKCPKDEPDIVKWLCIIWGIGGASDYLVQTGGDANEQA